jgi:hypothetical protein
MSEPTTEQPEPITDEFNHFPPLAKSLLQIHESLVEATKEKRSSLPDYKQHELRILLKATTTTACMVMYAEDGIVEIDGERLEGHMDGIIILLSMLADHRRWIAEPCEKAILKMEEIKATARQKGYTAQRGLWWTDKNSVQAVCEGIERKIDAELLSETPGARDLELPPPA